MVLTKKLITLATTTGTILTGSAIDASTVSSKDVVHGQNGFKFAEYNPDTSAGSSDSIQGSGEAFKQDLTIASKLSDALLGTYTGNSETPSRDHIEDADLDDSDQAHHKNLAAIRGNKTNFHVLASESTDQYGWGLVEECSSEENGETDESGKNINRLWLAFRGTYTFTNWLTDFTVIINDIGLDKELQCVGGHRGFQTYLDSVGDSMQRKMGFNPSQLMKPQFRDYLKKNSKCAHNPGKYDYIRIGGHSLGGAIATLAGKSLCNSGAGWYHCSFWCGSVVECSFLFSMRAIVFFLF